MIKKRQLLQKVQGDFKQTITTSGLNNSKVQQLIKKYAALTSQAAILSLRHLSRLIQNYQKQTTLSIESATKLSTSEEKQLEKQFSHQYHVNNVESKIDPSLFAGIRVRIGDDVYEDSLHSRLNQLKGAILS